MSVGLFREISPLSFGFFGINRNESSHAILTAKVSLDIWPLEEARLLEAC